MTCYNRRVTRTVRDTFDRNFYERFYFNRSTAVVTDEAVRRLATFVLAYMDLLSVEVRSLLDAGCGVGLWRDAVRGMRRDIDYTGIDPSEFLCEKYGWRQSTIAAFKSRRKFDLVVCQDVLQYMDDDDAAASLDNLARLCRGALYFDVPTKEDIKGGALDEKRTDHAIYLRSVRWYRRQLARHFVAAGGGVFIPKRSQTVVLALEKL